MNLVKKKIIIKIIIAFLVFSIIFSSTTIVSDGKWYSNDTWIPEEYIGYCEEIGEMYCVSPEFLESIIEAESSGKPDVVSSYGCIGLMQINPKYHTERMKKLGIDNLYDPYSNILTGTDYILELFEKYEDPYEVLKAYGGWSDTNGDAYIYKVLDRAYNLEIIHQKTPAVG